MGLRPGAPPGPGSRGRRRALGGLSTLVDTSVLVGTGSLAVEIEGGWSVSVVTVGELETGVLIAAAGPVRASRLRRLTAVLLEAPVLSVDRAVAERYGELRAATGRRPTNDLWIAATALAHDLTLVTRDEGQSTLPSIRVKLLP